MRFHTRAVVLGSLLALAGLVYAGIACPDPFSPHIVRGHCDQLSTGLYSGCSDDTLASDGGCDPNSRHSAYSCEVAEGTETLYTRALSHFVTQGLYVGYVYCDEMPHSQPAHRGLSTTPCDYCTGK